MTAHDFADLFDVWRWKRTVRAPTRIGSAAVLGIEEDSVAEDVRAEHRA